MSCSPWVVKTTKPMPSVLVKLIHHSHTLRDAHHYNQLLPHVFGRLPFSSPILLVKFIASFAVFSEVRIVGSPGSLERMKSRVNVLLLFNGSDPWELVKHMSQAWEK